MAPFLKNIGNLKIEKWIIFTWYGKIYVILSVYNVENRNKNPFF